MREYRLRDLIRGFRLFSEDEIRFIRHNSRVDFLLYNKIDKTPVLVIEVDGVSSHDNVIQKQRDDKKDHILKMIGLPLLRLSTDGYNEAGRIIEKLSAYIFDSQAGCVNVSKQWVSIARIYTKAVSRRAFFNE